MAQNLIDLLERLLGSNEVLSRIGALIGLSPKKTRAAISAAVPAILAGLVGVAQKPEGRSRLAALVQGQDDTGLLDNLAGALGGDREQALIDTGKGMLSSLFEQSKLNGIAGAISRSTSLDQSSAGSLLGILTPVVMGTLRREQRAQGLDAQGLARMLSDQKDNIAQALPAGVAGPLRLTGLLEGVTDRMDDGVRAPGQTGRAAAAEAARTASLGARAAPRAGGSALRWAIALVAVVAALWAGYTYLSRHEQVQEAADQATDQAVDTAAGVGEGAENLLVGDVDVGEQITGVFESATATLNGITDAASAEAAVPELNELNDSLGKLGGLVDQLPAEGKSALAALVSGSLSNLEALITKVAEIPGAGDVIRPVADSLLEKLQAMTA
jgi:hypothetical protein